MSKKVTLPIQIWSLLRVIILQITEQYSSSSYQMPPEVIALLTPPPSLDVLCEPICDHLPGDVWLYTDGRLYHLTLCALCPATVSYPIIIWGSQLNRYLLMVEDVLCTQNHYQISSFFSMHAP